MKKFKRLSTSRPTPHTNGTFGSTAASSSIVTSPTIEDDTISGSEYARKCKQLMQLNMELRDLGADMYLDIPRIAVIGSQSAGKSSLVEAISGITVPRDSGTCTRCPMECSMSRSTNTWSCSIRIRWIMDAHGDDLSASTIEDFGPKLTDREDAEIWIRRAQAAVLSPHLPRDSFLDKAEADLKSLMKTDSEVLKFSRNIIQVDVKDPDATELSFVDLPGLIQNQEQELIDLVRGLVDNAISGETTLILITIPMADDMENQQAFKLAKDTDPEGLRTIAVLTKPDMLTDGMTGSKQRWKDAIEGKSSHPLKHGYYCVRLPDDVQRAQGLNRAGLEAIAKDFFNTTFPWNAIFDRRRFGIRSFVQDISRILVGLMENNLPKMREKVAELLQECEVELKKLPDPPGNDPLTDMALLMNRFFGALTAAIFGEDHKTLVQTNRHHYDMFKMEIQRTSPDFRPYPDHMQYPNINLSNVTSMSSISPPLDLKSVQEIIEKSIGWELPGHVPYDATKKLISDFTKLWDGPAHSCFENVFSTLSMFIDQMMLEHFGQFKVLHEHARMVIKDELEKQRLMTLDFLARILQLEDIPFQTRNTDIFRQEVSNWRQNYLGKNLDTSPYPYSDALQVMATVQAYFQVSHRRIIDYVPMAIEHDLNQAVLPSIQKALSRDLINTADRARSLLSEDPAVVHRRTHWRERQARLLQIKKMLEDFQQVTVQFE